MVATAHWACLDIQFTRTATGVQIQVTTEVPCHLWMRWSLIVPQRHLVPRYLRGVRFREDLYLCLVAYHDNEQEEAGDTLVHTFIKEPWAVCETRYFYFHGTIAGVISPSTTACFSYHRLYPIVTSTFSPDKHPEITSVDGFTQKTVAPLSWAQIHDGPGTGSDDSGDLLIAEIQTFVNLDTFWNLYRSTLLFDTSIIPINHVILMAWLDVWVTTKRDEVSCNPSFAAFYSYPLSNTSLVPADYQRYHSGPLSNVLAFASVTVGAYNRLTILPSAYPFIEAGGITRLALREASFDAANIAPPWQANKYIGFRFLSSDSILSKPPVLTVVWQETL